MKNNRGVSLIEVACCLILISGGLMGVLKMEYKTVLMSRSIHLAENALVLAENYLRDWRYCDLMSASSDGVICHSFDEIKTFSKDTPPYHIDVQVNGIDPEDDGRVWIKKVTITVSWFKMRGEVQNIKVETMFVRENE